MTETEVDQPPEETAEEGDSPSANELLFQLGHDVTVLAFCEAELQASRNMPAVRRAVRDFVAALVAALALLTAFAFVNVAAFDGLAGTVDPWVAALILGGVWLAVGGVLVFALLVRAGRATGWHWWRVFSTGREETLQDLERARADAEQAVRGTLSRLGPVVAVELASASMPAAASSIVNAGSEMFDSSEEIVEAIVEELPGGSVVNQVWDVVLMPGRFGLKVATTVLKRDERGE